jgi:hypothetical protein
MSGDKNAMNGNFNILIDAARTKHEAKMSVKNVESKVEMAMEMEMVIV